MHAVFVVFTSTVKVSISSSAVYMGGDPAAELENYLPGIARTSGSSITFGGTGITYFLNQSLI